jgi:hypothetical protein
MQLSPGSCHLGPTQTQTADKQVNALQRRSTFSDAEDRGPSCCCHELPSLGNCHQGRPQRQTAISQVNSVQRRLPKLKTGALAVIGSRAAQPQATAIRALHIGYFKTHAELAHGSRP